MNVYDAEHITIPDGKVKRILDKQGVVMWEDKSLGSFYLTNDDIEPVTVSIKKSARSAPTISLEASDDGVVWDAIGNTSTSGLNIIIPVGGKKYLRSISDNAWSGSATTLNNYFSSTGKFGAHGSIMELLGYDILKGYDCCYMFYQCTLLTTPPSLPATTLAEYCYYYMFPGCTSLTTAPSLPATELANSCYYGMFESCSSLTTAPSLPAIKLAGYCYSRMFYGCTSLTTAPSLPATILATGCYSVMFANCTSLTTAPELQATTLVNSCYYGMFANCTSLTTAPYLGATKLVIGCYYQMFDGCSSLKEIKCNATDISANNCTGLWVSDVAATGTFYKNPNMSAWTTGIDGIPAGWTVQDL